MAAELAVSMDPPNAWTMRHKISHSARALPERVERQGDRRAREDQEAEVVDPDPAGHVAEPAEDHHEHGRHQQIAEDHPEHPAVTQTGTRPSPPLHPRTHLRDLGRLVTVTSGAPGMLLGPSRGDLTGPGAAWERGQGWKVLK
ncbi:hypothetical protein Ssi03_57920 [Sphaerisporangium siamense]|nr:hypothetical protein Ssi03_57920 [Sphaerisporangium siamense]